MDKTFFSLLFRKEFDFIGTKLVCILHLDLTPTKLKWDCRICFLKAQKFMNTFPWKKYLSFELCQIISIWNKWRKLFCRNFFAPFYGRSIGNYLRIMKKLLHAAVWIIGKEDIVHESFSDSLFLVKKLSRPWQPLPKKRSDTSVCDKTDWRQWQILCFLKENKKTKNALLLKAGFSTRISRNRVSSIPLNFDLCFFVPLIVQLVQCIILRLSSNTQSQAIPVPIAAWMQGHTYRTHTRTHTRTLSRLTKHTSAFTPSSSCSKLRVCTVWRRRPPW